ncbi:MAG: YfiR family protein [Gammaproteobacteria bacterium]
MRDQPRARGLRPFFSAAATLVACSALAWIPTGHAREAQRADALKAGYLFNFMKFVEWPPLAAADALTVCFLGNSGVYDELSAGLADKRLGPRRLIARRLAPSEPTVACQVLYIDAERLPDVSDLIVARPAALLTVSDAPEFLKGGGIIALFDEGNRLRFRISIDNARRANLHISSNLLQLASAVEREG